MTERIYICTDCEEEFEEFTAECPECGGTSFRTEVADHDDDLVDEVAKLSRAVNPVAPG